MWLSIFLNTAGECAMIFQKLGDDVTVVGYPVGGDNTSVSQGRSDI